MNLRRGGRRRELATIELTPLIDVVFLLLIFFLLTSTLSQAQQSSSRESTIPINLPEVSSGSTSVSDEPMMLTVTQEGTVIVEAGAQDLEGESVEAKLINLYKQNPDAQLLLRGDKGTTHGSVIQLLNSVRQIGFKRVDLVVARPAEQ